MAFTPELILQSLPRGSRIILDDANFTLRFLVPLDNGDTCTIAIDEFLLQRDPRGALEAILNTLENAQRQRKPDRPPTRFVPDIWTEGPPTEKPTKLEAPHLGARFKGLL